MASQENIIILLIALVASTSGLLQIRKDIKSANQAFNNFLLNAAQNYTAWITAHNLDPAPPISEALTLTSSSGALILLSCQLTQQQISGHSSNQNQVFEPESMFNSHYIGINREQEQRYHITGNFNCTGKMNSPAEENYHFQGEGTYQYNTTKVNEAVAHFNLGITEDYKFNFSVAHSDVVFRTTFYSAYYIGKWNDSRVTDTVANKITQDLTGLYSQFLLYNGDNPLHPARPLLLSFLRSVIEDVDLTTIIDQEDLPTPYKPNPTPPTNPTTTPTTTTPAATTESQTSENTEPNTTERNNEAAAIISVSSVLLIISLFLALKIF